MTTVSVFHQVTFTDEDRRERLNDHDGTQYGMTQEPGKDGPCGLFWGFCTQCSVKQVAEFTTDLTGTDALDKVYQQMQNGIEEVGITSLGWQPAETRSLSVGDVVVLDDQAFVVAGMGFHQVDLADVRRAVENYQANLQRDGWVAFG
jgi:hypothetical protein